MADRRRKDTYLPAESVEFARFMFSVAVLQGREGDEIEIYLPNAKEQVEQIVERSKPINTTVISELVDVV